MIAIILVFAVFINYVPKLDFNDSSLVTIESTETEAFVITSTSYLLLTALAVGGAMITAKYIENNKEQITRMTNKLWDDIKTAGGSVLNAIETGLAESGQNAYVHSQTMEVMAHEVRDFVYTTYGTTKDILKAKSIYVPEYADVIELNYYNPLMNLGSPSYFKQDIISPLLPYINTDSLYLPRNNGNNKFRLPSGSAVSFQEISQGGYRIKSGTGGSAGPLFYIDTGINLDYELVVMNNVTLYTDHHFDSIYTVDSSHFLNNQYNDSILFVRFSKDLTHNNSQIRYYNPNKHHNLYLQLNSLTGTPHMVLPNSDYIYLPFFVNDVNGNQKLVGGNLAHAVADKVINAEKEVSVSYIPLTNAQINDRVQGLSNPAGAISLPHENQLDKALDNLLDSAIDDTGSIAIDYDHISNNEIPIPIPVPVPGDINFPELDFDSDVPVVGDEVSGGLLSNLFSWLLSKLLIPLTWLGSLIQTGFNSIKNVLDGILTAVFSIPQLLTDIKSLIFSIPDLLTDIKDFVVGIPGYLTDILAGVLSIPGWLSDIFNGIIALPGLIVDGLVSTFQWVISLPTTIYDSIVAALEWVFVPDMSKVQVKLDGMILTMVNRFPIFYQIVDLFNALFGGLSSAPPSFTITMPVKWGGGTYSVFDIAMIDPYLPMIKNIFSVFIWLPFLWKFLKKIANFRN